MVTEQVQAKRVNIRKIQRPLLGPWLAHVISMKVSARSKVSNPGWHVQIVLWLQKR